ncbi:hypothetical protein, partial [Flavobacterium sp. TSSA_36]|uniref:hypothetical protein n=1 Tax=Flavobacterium sp. TSSA_36 TaxID=3447669 RepID=UPI003F30B224
MSWLVRSIMMHFGNSCHKFQLEHDSLYPVQQLNKTAILTSAKVRWSVRPIMMHFGNYFNKFQLEHDSLYPVQQLMKLW